MYNELDQNYYGWIYKIINLKNNKIYIGQTIRSISKRYQNHLYDSTLENPPMAISRAIKKYGRDNFKVEELAIINSEDLDALHDGLNQVEICLIKSFNSTDKTIGYNISNGGADNSCNGYDVDVYDINGILLNSFPSYSSAADYYSISDGTIRLIVNGEQLNYKNQLVFRNKGDYFDKYPIINSDLFYDIFQFDNLGNLVCIYHSIKEIFDKYRYYIRKELLNDPYRLQHGFWWSTENRFNYVGRITEKSVDAYAIDGKYINTYNSMSECGRALNILSSDIGAVCNGKLGSYHNFVFRYNGEPFDKYEIIREKNCNRYPVNQYSKDNKFIASYDSVTEATKCFTDSKNYNISNCCKHKQSFNTAYGYKWFYCDDPNQPDKTKIRNRYE